MELLVKRKEIVSLLLKQNVLVSRQVLEQLQQPDVVEEWHNKLTSGTPYEELSKPLKKTTVNNISHTKPNVTVLQNYTKEVPKKSVQDFVKYFHARYKKMNRLLQQRGGLQNLTSIARLQGKQDNDKVSLIAYVIDIQTTKNEHLILTLEDDTGRMNAIISKDKEDVINTAKDIVVDQVLGFTGTSAKNTVFIDSIVIPDIPLTHEFKKSDEDAHIAIISDIHVGSDLFLEDEFKQFLTWIRGESGTEKQREQAAKTKYVIVAGDMVDGVGIYPKQNEELTIPDIYDQYEKVAELLEQIPQDKTIIMIPGNHDAGRLSEPQLPLNPEWAPRLYQLPNLISLSNPCIVRIHTTPKTPGFDFLIYHGYSYDYYGDMVESIRTSGKNISERVGMIMEYLLKQRHLAPSHGSTLYVPDKEDDPLIIERVPDFFVSGHIHKVAIRQYRGINLISSSCWQAKTPFQEKVGHEPEPCKVPLINLKTREITLLDFTKEATQ